MATLLTFLIITVWYRKIKEFVHAYDNLLQRLKCKSKGMGKNCFDTLVINDTLANVVGSTDSTL